MNMLRMLYHIDQPAAPTGINGLPTDSIGDQVNNSFNYFSNLV